MLLLSYGLVEVSLIVGKSDTVGFKLAKLLTWRNYIYLFKSLECQVLGDGGSVEKPVKHNTAGHLHRAFVLFLSVMF